MYCWLRKSWELKILCRYYIGIGIYRCVTVYCYLATTLPVADDNWTLKYFPFFPPHTFSLWVYLIHTERRVLPFSSLIIELNSCWYWYHHKWLGDVTIRRAQPVQMKGKSSLVFDSVWDDETYVLPKCHVIGLSPIYSRDNSLMQCLHLLAEMARMKTGIFMLIHLWMVSRQTHLRHQQETFL